MKFGADIYGAQRINPNDSDPLIFHLAPPGGRDFHCEISQHVLDRLVQHLAQTLVVPGRFMSDFGDPMTSPLVPT